MRHRLGRMAISIACVLAGAMLASFVSLSSSAAASESAQADKSIWIELGTNAGPIPNPTRSEPAHLLLWRDQAILIDAGDGVAEQLVKAHVRLDAVQTIFLSHLHFDHTGGLFGLLGLRYQMRGPSRVTAIYGPPGTKRLVDGLLAAIQPGSALVPKPLPDWRVVELNDGSKISVGDVRVTAASNSHYILWSGPEPRPVSLSYRFDLPDRSIVYTGDTGPSRNVEKLARGADLLVSEVIDADTAIDRLKSELYLPSEALLSSVRDHFTKEHLVPDQVGLLAARADVHALVLTHFGGATGSNEQIVRLTNTIATHFKGPIHFANDLERY